MTDLIEKIDTTAHAGLCAGTFGGARAFFEDIRALFRPTHKHVKRGGEYVLIGFGKMQAEDWVTEHGRDGCRLVDMLEVAIYRCVEDGTLWVRPKEEFNDGRFLDLRPL